MNGVKAIGIDVIRKATRTTDSAHHDEILPRNTQFRENLLDRVKDNVVSTPGTPPDVIGRSKILLGFFLRRLGCGGRHDLVGYLMSSKIFSRISDTVNGCPCILSNPMASIMHSPRKSVRKCPVKLSSGMRIFLNFLKISSRSSGNG